jgi:hypothetical protein
MKKFFNLVLVTCSFFAASASLASPTAEGKTTVITHADGSYTIVRTDRLGTVAERSNGGFYHSGDNSNEGHARVVKEHSNQNGDNIRGPKQ